MKGSGYQVLLVEDEISIREGIEDVIPWDSLGFTFMAGAKNGKEALEIFDNLAPDVVITDIHMPKMNGLALAKAIRERSRKTKIVILTGFDEFEYARTALKLKVSDYLLKPVSPSELTGLLTRMKDELDRTASRENSNASLKDYELARRMAMVKLISGINDSEFTNDLIKRDSLMKEARWLRAVIYDFDQIQRAINPDTYRTAFHYLNPEGIHSELLPDHLGILIEILFSTTQDEDDTKIKAVVQKKRQYLSQHTRLSLSSGIGNSVKHVALIHQSYISAQSALSRRYVQGGDLDFFYTLEQSKQRKDIIFSFLKSIEYGTVDEWEEYLSDIIKELKQAKASEEHCQEIMTLVISAMINFLRQSVQGMTLEKMEDSLIIKKARSYKTLDALHSWLIGLIHEFTDQVKRQRIDAWFALAEKAKAYMNTHYMRSSLSFEDICRPLIISQSTLSRILKTYLDTNFSSYLRDVRIRAAKKLIRQTDLRNKEIAFRVGFNSPHYFSHVFTKQVGYSPTEYRRKIKEH